MDARLWGSSPPEQKHCPRWDSQPHWELRKRGVSVQQMQSYRMVAQVKEREEVDGRKKGLLGQEEKYDKLFIK